MKTGKEMAADVLEEIEMRQNQIMNKKRKPVGRVVMIAVILAAFFSTAAFGVVRFMIPKGLESSIGNELTNVLVVSDEKNVADSITVVNKSIETNGKIVTFEAIAEGENIRTIFTKDVGDTDFVKIEKKDLYAIISIRNSDKTAVKEISATDYGYIPCVEGYAPNQAMFEYIAGFYTDENGTLYIACLLTDVKPFAGENLYLAVFEEWPATAETIRMDKDGKPFFTDYYKGIKAIFDLPLPEKYADKKAADEMRKIECFITNPDYSGSDKLIERDIAFKNSGIDLSKYIGDNEWKGWYPLQFGKVANGDEYIAHRNDWKQTDIKTLSFDEVTGAADKALAELEKNVNLEKLGDKDYALVEKYIAEAQFKAEYFPTDASYMSLSDGSKAYYLPCNSFVHLRNDGTASLVYAASKNVVVEINGIDALNNYYSLTFTGVTYTDRTATNPVTVAGWYLDGVGFDKDYPTFAGGDIKVFEDSYNQIVKDFSADTDAVAVIADEFFGHPGTIEVIM